MQCLLQLIVIRVTHLRIHLVQVAGNPHAQLGEEVAAQVAGMKGSADSPPQATSPSAQASGAAAAVFPSRTTSARASQASRQGGNVQAQAPAGTLPAAAASNAGPGGDAAAQPQAAHAPNGPTCASPNDMEEYLHWAFGRTPSQILQQPIIGQPIVSQPRAGGARGPVYTEDQHAGGWLDSEGMLHMRRHGVNSLPSGTFLFNNFAVNYISMRSCQISAGLYTVVVSPPTNKISYSCTSECILPTSPRSAFLVHSLR